MATTAPFLAFFSCIPAIHLNQSPRAVLHAIEPGPHLKEAIFFTCLKRLKKVLPVPSTPIPLC